jgi:hypothetical protein
MRTTTALLLLGAFACTFACACGKKSSQTGDSQNKMSAADRKERIAGRWRSTRTQLGMSEPTKVKSPASLELDSNGTYKETMYGKTFEGKYELQGKKLILHHGGKSRARTIERLTKDELVLTTGKDGKIFGRIFWRRER